LQDQPDGAARARHERVDADGRAVPPVIDVAEERTGIAAGISGHLVDRGEESVEQ
jgi:hypothetical protein